MSFSQGELVLPRPGEASSSSPTQPRAISGPAEAAFRETFGALLPPARYLRTVHGKAAYYEIVPSTSSSFEHNKQTPDRVLFVHGVQTPALGMLPLAHALQESFPGGHFVLVDLWGHGLSDTPLVPHDAALFHQLLDALLEHLGWPSTHIVGYSFGGALTVGYVASRSSRVRSFVLVAPAGLIQSAKLPQAHLRRPCDDEAAARQWVLEYLEGGQLVVPADWKERVARGEVVANAVKEWQMREHPGHVASVVAVLRDGGALDNNAEFVRALRTNIPSFAVLGELDDVCTERELRELGFAKVAVVAQAGHGVVRENKVSEVAALIGEFWTSLDHGR